ncbi:MAG: hypothetical protein ABL897_10990 [Hyphomicrobium sp.]
MAEHLLTLKYEGRLADRHEMDGADIHHAYEGGKRLLALHGYAYTEGRLPRNKLTNTPYFYIRSRALREGSVLLDVLINVIGSAVWDMTKYSYRQYFMPNVKSWLQNQQPFDPWHARIEPTLRPMNNQNAPFIDHEDERKRLSREMHAGCVQAFGQITRPLGTYADSVELLFDGDRIARLVDRIKEYEINEAVTAYRNLIDVRPRSTEW